MVTEFVLIEDGKETDWIDPVLDFTESPDHWSVWNGYSTYLFVKRPGVTYKIRAKEFSDDE